MRIILQIEARWPALNSAKRQMLHSVRTYGAQFQSMMDGVADHPFREYLEELQHLNELALASRAAVLLGKPGFHKAAETLKLFTKVPVLQGRRLVQGTDLALKQVKVMEEHHRVGTS